MNEPIDKALALDIAERLLGIQKEVSTLLTNLEMAIKELEEKTEGNTNENRSNN
jgi:hypothetical protein